jgi:hypothetical protein
VRHPEIEALLRKMPILTGEHMNECGLRTAGNGDVSR